MWRTAIGAYSSSVAAVMGPAAEFCVWVIGHEIFSSSLVVVGFVPILAADPPLECAPTGVAAGTGII
jgi:hypothetical protein